MLIEYINRAMSKAEYEKLEDGTYCGMIKECPGTIAFGKTLYECQKELRSVLEGWLIVKIRHGDTLPVIDGLDVNKGISVLREASTID
ncbi:MAG: type II toxin-antitoxin system HicB family antitoxin [Methanosarcinales archaeon]